ncbi:hypothetical protein AURANDRAFT_65676 [Aureococcus anophagefferens]|uniref:Uncharacterized protein n=1 Tax=Aureococcus anophagefferens TaxID=44056 RepID=F0YES5_AURAN|nr:hypothetical protein AURANDRAFT_65676 [Aureococcus anophagefferens]EGB06303.1 hypothetical protein AURANDRAFT_65676 [Aureococcus anophagefferens]|eukprot:XP_009038883.1 hypothetical protein AURANDRAFT_65676 [Aureococcus anophagefferens]
MIAAGAGIRTAAALSGMAQEHARDMFEDDAAVGIAEAGSILGQIAIIEEVTDPIQACTVYFEKAPATSRKALYASALQWLARCAYAMLNRLGRQTGSSLKREEFDMAVAAITRQICGSRRQVMPRAFPDLHSRSTMTLVALVNTTQSGDTMLPVLVAFTVETSRGELCTMYNQFRYDVHRSMLYCLAEHLGFGFASQNHFDVVASNLGKRYQAGLRRGLVNEGCYWGFEDDKSNFAVWYGIPYAIVVGAPADIVAQLSSPRHTKGIHQLHDLTDRSTVSLILDAAKRGSPCSALEMLRLLRDPRAYATVKV